MLCSPSLQEARISVLSWCVDKGLHAGSRRAGEPWGRTTYIIVGLLCPAGQVNVDSWLKGNSGPLLISLMKLWGLHSCPLGDKFRKASSSRLSVPSGHRLETDSRDKSACVVSCAVCRATM